jgi:hypothetical protein
MKRKFEVFIGANYCHIDIEADELSMDGPLMFKLDGEIVACFYNWIYWRIVKDNNEK